MTDSNDNAFRLTALSLSSVGGIDHPGAIPRLSSHRAHMHSVENLRTDMSKEKKWSNPSDSTVFT